MRKFSISVEYALYAGILLVAFALRFAFLGDPPLNEVEAQAVYPAHQIARGQDVSLGNQAGYTLLAAISFSLTSSSEFIARFWPALFGVALVALAYFWREVIGPKPALVLAALLALDPGMVAVSRLASGRMIALAAGLLAITAWRYERNYLAVTFGIIAILAAPTIFIGLLVLLVTTLIFPLRKKSFRSNGSKVRRSMALAAAFYLLGTTLFFIFPSGLSAFGNVVSGFLTGWGQASGVSSLEVLFALFAYNLPVIVFGLIGGFRSWTRSVRAGKQLPLATLFAVLIVGWYPGRQVADLVWVTLTLAILSAIELSRYFHLPMNETKAAFGEMGLVLILGLFFYLMLAKASTSDPNSELFRTVLLAAGAVPLLLAIATVLISYGWSRQAAAHGLVWGVSLLSVMGMLSASSHFANPNAGGANELWRPGPSVGELRLVEATLGNLSSWEEGQPEAVAVKSRVESAVLDWILRDYPEPRNDLLDSSPQLVITGIQAENQANLATYRGQSFPLYVHRAWSAWPPNLLKWLLYREAPTFSEQAILWVSADLLPGGTVVQETSGTSSSTP
ncbi:MAG: hypothetical protein ACRDFQ_02495 [Anaerolineales bacterium]